METCQNLNILTNEIWDPSYIDICSISHFLIHCRRYTPINNLSNFDIHNKIKDTIGISRYFNNQITCDFTPKLISRLLGITLSCTKYKQSAIIYERIVLVKGVANRVKTD